jgi:hypothetical protein
VAAAAPSKKPRVSVAMEHEEWHIGRDTLVLRLPQEREWQQFKVLELYRGRKARTCEVQGAP